MNPFYRDEWPMDIYMSSWKLFRCMSDENKETAKHLIKRKKWPKHNSVNILDIGCGDGLLIKQIITQCPNTINEVRLLDPDEELLREAYLHITEIDVVKSIHTYLNKIEQKVPECYEKVNVILAVHVIYLLKEESFRKMLEELPENIPIYIVLDKPNSIFTRLWKETARKYYSRSIKTHKIIEKLPSHKYSIKKSSINSCLDNPLNIDRAEIRDSILSLLCYADVRDMSTQEHNKVREEIIKVMVDGKVMCESACYEIIRKNR